MIRIFGFFGIIKLKLYSQENAQFQDNTKTIVTQWV